LLRHLRRYSRDALIDGIPYRQYWGEVLATGGGRHNHVTLNSDDPGMFATTLNREYEIAHEVFGLSPGELADLAKAAVRYSFADADTQATLSAAIDRVAGVAGVAGTAESATASAGEG